jgi:hypothetical protein
MILDWAAALQTTSIEERVMRDYWLEIATQSDLVDTRERKCQRKERQALAQRVTYFWLDVDGFRFHHFYKFRGGVRMRTEQRCGPAMSLTP